MLSHMATTAAQRIREFAWCCAAVIGTLLVSPPAALAQDAPRPVCVAAADADTGPVAALGDVPGGMLIGAEKGLFLARAADGKLTVTPVRGDRAAERVLSIHSLPGGGALVGAWNGVFVAREAGGTISVAAVVDPNTGPVFAMRGVPGGVLIGAAEGLFLARQADGKLTVARAGDTGRVGYMFDFPGGGVLIAADKGLFFARAEGGKVALAPVAMVAPATPDGIMPLRSMRSVPGGGVLIEGYVWFLAREVKGQLTVALAGDADTGVVDAMIELPGGALLIHTEQKGWFMGRAEGGKLAVTPAGDADTGRVFQMKHLGGAVLIWARNGLFVGRAAGGKVTVAPARRPETGQLFQMRDFAGGLLISAERGLFFAREQDGKVTVAPVGANTGPAQAEGIHDLPGGGTLIQARKEWFVAHAAGGKVTLTSAGTTDPGRIALIRNFGGGVLVGAERGVFVAAAGRVCDGR